jgi:beta-glucosidase
VEVLVPRPRRTAAVLAVAVVALAAVTSTGSGASAATALPKPCPSKAAHPWCDTSMSPDARAALFLKAMTQDEEITLVGGNGTGASPHTGATYAIPRLGLPAVYFSDGPVGPRQGAATAMPIPMALAATWNPGLAYEHGQEIADEAKHKGNDVVFAPTVNVMRTPQGGRTYEAYGEETYLVAQTARGWIQGAQSTGVIADVKHYLANNQEGQLGVPPLSSVNGGRQVVDAQVDERTLREVYMPHFEAAVKQAHVGTIMCSYNRVNGTYACENPHTLQQVLEKEWGFKGIVLSDYGASKDTVGNMNNGLDFVPNQGEADQSYDPRLISAALASGAVSKATLDAHVLRILRTLFAYGYFDRPGYAIDEAAINVKAHEQTAESIEERAITLLKNDGVLPLKPGVKKIAVIGPYADQFVTGGGSGTVTARSVVTALQGIRTRAGQGITVTYADGSDATAAAALAKAADVAVVVVGDVQTEGQDKDCVDLNCTDDLANSESVLVLQGRSCGQVTCPLNGTNEDGLISSVAAAQKKTVVVLETGGPVLTPWRSSVAAVVEAWYPGQQGGTALARVLFGDVDPGGRLPATFPDSAGQLPTAGSPRQYPGVAEMETYSEGLLVGYKWYDAKKLVPAYPFGAGLSYTTFRYGPLTVKAAKGPDQVAVATMTVTNTGHRAGVAVPQLYISKPGTAALPQPVRQLVGYTSAQVPAGRTVQVSFPLNDRSFASWGSSGWTIVPGCYGLAVGSSSRSLPSRTTIARGPGCAAAAVRLGTAGSFALPLPAVASTRSVAAAAAPAAAVRPASGSLPTTGGSPLVAWLAALALGSGLVISARRRRWV